MSDEKTRDAEELADCIRMAWKPGSGYKRLAEEHASLTAQLAAATRRAEEAEKRLAEWTMPESTAATVRELDSRLETTTARVRELETALQCEKAWLRSLEATGTAVPFSPGEARARIKVLDAILATPPAAPATPQDAGAVPVGDGLPSVGGEHTEATWAEHDRRCRMLLAEEQEKPSPNNALIAVLCDSVRLVREAVAFARAPIAAPASPSAPATCGTCGGSGEVDETVGCGAGPRCGHEFRAPCPECAEPEARLCESAEAENFSGREWVFVDTGLGSEHLECRSAFQANIIARRLSAPLTQAEREQLRAGERGKEG